MEKYTIGSAPIRISDEKALHREFLYSWSFFRPFQQLEGRLQALDSRRADQLQVADGVLDDAGSGAD